MTLQFHYHMLRIQMHFEFQLHFQVPTTTTPVSATSDPINNLFKDEATNDSLKDIDKTFVPDSSNTTYEPISSNTRSQRSECIESGEWICRTCSHVNPLCNAFCTGLISRNKVCCTAAEDSVLTGDPESTIPQVPKRESQCKHFGRNTGQLYLLYVSDLSFTNRIPDL